MIGGLFGLHHLYLGRDAHAFITFATFGGYFSLGLIRDLWRLPEYLRDANNDLEFQENLHAQMRKHKRPPSSIVRQSGLMIMGNLFAYLVEYAIPKDHLTKEISLTLRFLLVPFASAFGVWLAGNVGRHQGSLDKPLIAAYLVSSPAILLESIQFGSFSTLAAVIVFNRYSKEWRVKPPKKTPVMTRILALSLGLLLYGSLWLSGLYHNCTIEDPDTQRPIKCHIALQNFFKSSAYTNLSEALWMLYEHARHQGISGLWAEMMQEFDVSGKNTALNTLGLESGATKEQIIAQYKKLSREYHPDRERDESKKRDKHEQFIKVQQAYQLLKPRIN